MAMSDFRAHDGKCTCLVFVDDEVDSILERYERASGTDAAYIDFEDCVDTANNGPLCSGLRVEYAYGKGTVLPERELLAFDMSAFDDDWCRVLFGTVAPNGSAIVGHIGNCKYTYTYRGDR